MHVYIEDIGKHEGEEVTLKGWLHNRRSSGRIHFLIVRDGTGFIQAVLSKAAVGDDAFGAQARAALEAEGIDLAELRTISEEATGVALILVDARGEPQYVWRWADP